MYDTVHICGVVQQARSEEPHPLRLNLIFRSHGAFTLQCGIVHIMHIFGKIACTASRKSRSEKLNPA
jgi:hypothetical protein